jgi:flagellar P-ring protein FlgI
VAGADGSQLVVNIPTVGRIPRGASVERMVPTSFLESENLIFNLHQGDFTTANNMAEGINAMFGPDVAVPLDSSSVRVRAPADPAQRVSFLSLIENIEVDAASPSAKVIVNARTGTVVIGGNVRVTPAAVSHGKMTVKITENTIVTPNGQNVTTNGTTTVATPAAPTITPSSTLEATDTPARAFVFDAGVSLSSLVDAINAVGAAPADLVAILEALREAGALRAELIII